MKNIYFLKIPHFQFSFKKISDLSFKLAFIFILSHKITLCFYHKVNNSLVIIKLLSQKNYE